MSDHPASPSPLLAVRGLAFSRDESPIFGPLDFSVDGNEALLVQGGNGAGKTTLLRSKGNPRGRNRGRSTSPTSATCRD